MSQAENDVKLIGRLTMEPEVKTLPSGAAVCNFTVAVNGRGPDADADFIDCAAYGGWAENLGKADKGCLMYISGHLSQQKWQVDSADGNGKENRSRLVVRARKVYDFSGRFHGESDEAEQTESSQQG